MRLSRWVPNSRAMEHELLVRRALCSLPVDIQHKIVTIVTAPPPAPTKSISARLRSHMARWAHPRRPSITPRVLFT